MNRKPVEPDVLKLSNNNLFMGHFRSYPYIIEIRIRKEKINLCIPVDDIARAYDIMEYYTFYYDIHPIFDIDEENEDE